FRRRPLETRTAVDDRRLPVGGAGWRRRVAPGLVVFEDVPGRRLALGLGTRRRDRARVVQSPAGFADPDLHVVAVYRQLPGIQSYSCAARDTRRFSINHQR